MLFLKECKAVGKSVIYFAFIAVILLFYITQLGNYGGNDIRQYTTQEETTFEKLSDNPLIAPLPGQDNYGYKLAEIPEQVMPNAIVNLAQEMRTNEFAAYPTGFYRNVKLSPAQLSKLRDLLTELTGLPELEIYSRYVEKSQAEGSAVSELYWQVDYSDVIPVLVDYDTFKQKMAQVDEMIGGGSGYASQNLKHFGSAPITYEEKLTEYNLFINEDRITGAYARLFCDYMGIVIALFAVFVPVSLLMRDRRAKMNELIYSRKATSHEIVLARYCAVVAMSILPLLLLSFLPLVQLTVFGVNNGFAVDYLAFIKYIATWIMPTILFTTAIGFFFTTLTDTPIAILIQFLLGFLGLFASADALEGGRYGIEIAIRHNTLGNFQLLKDNVNALITNRLSYTVISVLLIIATIFFYSLKRRGKLDVRSRLQKVFKSGKSAGKTESAI